MKSKITRVCLTGCVYTLFFYLLYSSEDEIKNTFFFFCTGVAKELCGKFSRKYFFDLSKKWYWIWILRLSFIMIKKLFCWRFLKKAEIYGHDHLGWSDMLIGHKKYHLIEDGPYILSIYKRRKRYKDYCDFWENKHFYLIKRLVRLLVGQVYKAIFGANKQCIEVILSVDDEAPYPTGRKTIKSLEEMYNAASNEKKEFILNVFDISGSLDILKTKSIIFLTGCFAADKVITEEEEIQICRDSLLRYNLSDVVIKPHPRNSINYEKYFPGVYVFKQYVPMQLINLIGITFKKAITVCSSSALLLPKETEVIWLGTKIHPEIYKRYGDMEPDNYVKHS